VTGFGHYHEQLLAHGWRQFDAAQLDASAPAGYVLREQREKHIAKLLDFIVGVGLGVAPLESVELLVVVVLDCLAHRCKERIALAGDVHSTALFLFLRLRLRLFLLLRGLAACISVMQVESYSHNGQRTYYYETYFHDYILLSKVSASTSLVVKPMLRR